MGSRKECTEAIGRIAKQSFESVTNINPCLLLPKKTFRISFPEKNTNSTEASAENLTTRTCDIIYNNDDFRKESCHEINRPVEMGHGKSSNNRNYKKKSKMPIVKRLAQGPRTSLGTSTGKNKVNLSKAGRTRSGKIYSRVV